MRRDIVEVKELIDSIIPLLEGKSPEHISAALADLTATLFAGYIGKDRNKIRKELLAQHIQLIRDLIPINEESMLRRIKERSN
jgi:hypothetical protein